MPAPSKPVTPQRPTRSSIHWSSPLTPYTPLSIRSFSSSNSSALTTPASVNKKHLSFSPELAVNNRDKSLADIAENWRSRATENGIRVTDDAQYAADDEASDPTNSPLPIQSEEALLAPSFFSAHRRARAYSHAPPPLPSSLPLTPRTPLNPNINTPPQKPSRVKSLTLKGSYTDPAHTRRRPAFGQTTTDLFDIDENAYAPYPQSSFSFASPEAPRQLHDPFSVIVPPPTFPVISEAEFHALHAHARSPSHLLSHSRSPSNVSHSSSHSLPPTPVLLPLKLNKETKGTSPTSCSVCGRSPSSLAILSPCTHPLCSACLTSALNIVGEKDMACAVCKAGVNDFYLQASSPTSSSTSTSSSNFVSPMDINPFAPKADGLLPSAFRDISGFSSNNRGEGQTRFWDFPREVSTPRLEKATKTPEEYIVLRIDNVPWDITPPAIHAFLRLPQARVHVLLDRKGKTLSHAFVEVRGEEEARAALRGAQNAVLGRGKRARGVTVTRSGQEELMRALFPSWRGTFDGSKPSLNGLDNVGVIAALETGLMSPVELDALLHLVRSPDSHFLKAPELPFHALMNILAKFPADIDSRVFWSCELRDTLFDVTFAAIQVLLSRIHTGSGPGDPDLVAQLIHAGTSCAAFTTQQISQLADLRSPSPSPRRENEKGRGQGQDEDRSPVGALAREFGVEAELVHALAQRLSGMC